MQPSLYRFCTRFNSSTECNLAPGRGLSDSALSYLSRGARPSCSGRNSVSGTVPTTGTCPRCTAQIPLLTPCATHPTQMRLMSASGAAQTASGLGEEQGHGDGQRQHVTGSRALPCTSWTCGISRGRLAGETSSLGLCLASPSCLFRRQAAEWELVVLLRCSEQFGQTKVGLDDITKVAARRMRSR